jgi:hypothetical protein
MKKEKIDRQYRVFLRLRDIPELEREEASCVFGATPIQRERPDSDETEARGATGRRGKIPPQNSPR